MAPADDYGCCVMRNPYIALAIGALAITVLAFYGTQKTATEMTAGMSHAAQQAITLAGGRDVEAHFVNGLGFATRHPLLTGGEELSLATRDRTAKAVAAIPGVGGIRWADSKGLAAGSAETQRPLRCQDDVQALLRTRSIRFEESSANIEAASRSLIDEVAAALKPCLGSIIAITGHTDASGPEPGNLALSEERAEAVMEALIARGIPADGLRARGVGSRQPVQGLEPLDPANRRIDFSVIEMMPIRPTPVDTPGPQ